jgi:hypothetical protein
MENHLITEMVTPHCQILISICTGEDGVTMAMSYFQLGIELTV